MTTERTAASPSAGAKPRTRRLKTWTAFGDLGRAAQRIRDPHSRA